MRIASLFVGAYLITVGFGAQALDATVPKTVEVKGACSAPAPTKLIPAANALSGGEPESLPLPASSEEPGMAGGPPTAESIPPSPVEAPMADANVVAMADHPAPRPANK